MAVSPIKSTFRAVMDRQPGSGPKLEVVGDVELWSTGWTVSLRRAQNQGPNPSALVLDLIAIPPDGPSACMVVEEEVYFKEHAPKVNYEEVTIRYGRDAFSVKAPVLV